MPNCLKAVKNTTCIVKISAQAYFLICAWILFLNLLKNHSLNIICIYTCSQAHNLAIFLSWLESLPQLAKIYTHTVNHITKYVRDQLKFRLTFRFFLSLVTLSKFLFLPFHSCTNTSERFVAVCCCCFLMVSLYGGFRIFLCLPGAGWGQDGWYRI